MRSAAVSLLLLVSISTLLLTLPAASARALSQDAGAVPAALPDLPATIADPAAAEPSALTAAALPAVQPTAGAAAANPAQNGINVDVLVYVEKANCADVKDQVNVDVSTWVKRVLVLVKVDTTTCSPSTTKSGTVIVTVKVNVPVPAFGVNVNVLTSTINRALGKNLKIDELAKRNKEIKNLVDWANKKGYKVAKVEVKVTA